MKYIYTFPTTVIPPTTDPELFAQICEAAGLRYHDNDFTFLMQELEMPKRTANALGQIKVTGSALQYITARFYNFCWYLHVSQGDVQHAIRMMEGEVIYLPSRTGHSSYAELMREVESNGAFREKTVASWKHFSKKR